MTHGEIRRELKEWLECGEEMGLRHSTLIALQDEIEYHEALMPERVIKTATNRQKVRCDKLSWKNISRGIGDA